MGVPSFSGFRVLSIQLNKPVLLGSRLPSVQQNPYTQVLRQLPKEVPSANRRRLAYLTLAGTLALSTVVAFNHQKSSASITHSTYVLAFHFIRYLFFVF